MKRLLILLSCIISASAFSSSLLASKTAYVSGFARSFIMGSNLSNATITILETGEQLKTDKDGRFGPFEYPVGQPVTLELKKWNYKTTQSATVTVPEEGLVGPHNNITFQVPTIETFYILSTIIGKSQDPDSCQVAGTIIDYHKTMDDIPQGIEGTKVSFPANLSEAPFYFGIFESGPLKDKTNPFAKGLKETSKDGGFLLINVPAREKLYTVGASKQGINFTKAQFWCRKGAFINLSPPQGPMATKSVTPTGR